MAVNFYPPCPEPELTYGLPAHTDPNALTILLQDLMVPGLQVLKDGKWVAVDPHPDAFVINIGDQLQVNLHISFVFFTCLGEWKTMPLCSHDCQWLHAGTEQWKIQECVAPGHHQH